jgi:hypothetical protein
LKGKELEERVLGGKKGEERGELSILVTEDIIIVTIIQARSKGV